MNMLLLESIPSEEPRAQCCNQYLHLVNPVHRFADRQHHIQDQVLNFGLDSVKLKNWAHLSTNNF